MTAHEPDLSYEQALALLDQRLRDLEQGDLSLEAALKAVEEARDYLRICQDRLEAAKRKIEVRPEAAAGAPPAPSPSPAPAAEISDLLL